MSERKIVVTGLSIIGLIIILVGLFVQFEIRLNVDNPNDEEDTSA